MFINILNIFNSFLFTLKFIFMYLQDYIKVGPFHHYNNYKEFLKMHEHDYKSVFKNFLKAVSNTYDPKKHSIDIKI